MEVTLAQALESSEILLVVGIKSVALFLVIPISCTVYAS